MGVRVVVYRPDRRDCSPIRARPVVGDRRADRRDAAADHRIAQPDVFYSIAFAVFVLPLYVTLIVAGSIERLGAAVRGHAIEDESGS